MKLIENMHAEGQPEGKKVDRDTLKKVYMLNKKDSRNEWSKTQVDGKHLGKSEKTRNGGLRSTGRAGQTAD